MSRIRIGNDLITGGELGFEAGIKASVVFGISIIILLILMTKKR